MNKVMKKPRFRPIGDYKELREHLRELGTGAIAPTDPRNGICREIESLANKFQMQLDVAFTFRSWPLFSGSAVFPVPHPVFEPLRAFSIVLNKWADDEYGDNRRALCLHIADELEETKGDPAEEHF